MNDEMKTVMAEPDAALMWNIKLDSTFGNEKIIKSKLDQITFV